MKEYNEVPNVISVKDLEYLTDIFNWSYMAYKISINTAVDISDDTLRKHIEKTSKVFMNSMENVLDILEEGEDNE